MTLFLRPRAKIVLAALVLTAGGSGAIAFRKTALPDPPDTDPAMVASATLPAPDALEEPGFTMASSANKVGQEYTLPDVVVPASPFPVDAGVHEKHARTAPSSGIPPSGTSGLKSPPSGAVKPPDHGGIDGIADASLFRMEVKRPVVALAPTEPVLEKSFPAPPVPPAKPAPTKQPRSIVKSLPPITESTVLPNTKIADPVPPLHRMVPIRKVSTVPLPPLSDGLGEKPVPRMRPLRSLPDVD